MTIAERLGSGKRVATPLNEDGGPPAAVRTVPKHHLPRDAVLLLILILASTGSFGLGVVAGKEGGGGEDIRVERSAGTEQAAAVGLATSSTELVRPAEKVVPTPEPVTPAKTGAFVASKTGTKYYLPWCGSVKRIKEENKVWFGTKTEAEAAGYEPAKNCKGL